MAKFRAITRDRDLGYRRARRGVKKTKSRKLKAGITKPSVAKYAVVHEGKHAFFRDTFDRRKGDLMRRTASAQDEMIKGESGDEQIRELAEEYAKEVKRQIGSLGLVETGAMRGSVEVAEG